MIAALLIAVLAGCSADFADRPTSTEYPSDPSSTSPTDAVVELRVRVIPSELEAPEAEDAGAPAFRALPQTFRESAPASAAEIDVGGLALRSPVLQAGVVTGYKTNPLVAALPGSTIPVDGIVRLSQPGSSLQSYFAYTDGDGAWQVWAVPDLDYRLQIVPSDPMLPMLSETLDVLDPAAEHVVDLGAGTPIYGRVTSAGFGLGGMRVRAMDVDGVSSATAITDGSGLYQVRVAPGTWSVVCDGRDNGLDPALDLGMVEVPSEGLVANVEYPTMTQSAFSGRIEGPSGDPVVRASVRLVSESVDGFGDLSASWTGEGVTNEDGRFAIFALPGTYTLEVTPPDTVEGAGLSPIRLTGRALAAAPTALPDVRLASLVTVSGQVYAQSSSAPLASAYVSCTEIGFGERTFATFTAAGGVFAMDLPNVPLICYVDPPSSDETLARLRTPIDPGQVTSGYNLPLTVGTMVTGSVLLEGVPEQYAVVEVRDASNTLLGSGLTNAEGAFALRINLASAL